MRVFLTGATGFVGSAVIKELLSAGHEVLGLTRSDKGAKMLADAGAQAHHGTLEDLDSLRRGAKATDGTIHCGFIHDFSDWAAACAIDRAAIETMGAILAGSGRPFLVTSGLAGLAPGRLRTEEEDPAPDSTPRAASEGLALALAPRGVRVSVVRLAPSVHGEGDHGFVPALIGIARKKGVSAYIGEGTNRWSAVHRFDAARLYRLALEGAPAGTKLHGAAEEEIPTRVIAEVIGRRLNLPVVSVAPEKAGEHFGWIGRFFALGLSASSALTRERLGWQPSHPGLIADLEAEPYFAN